MYMLQRVEWTTTCAVLRQPLLTGPGGRPGRSAHTTSTARSHRTQVQDTLLCGRGKTGSSKLLLVFQHYLDGISFIIQTDSITRADGHCEKLSRGRLRE